MTRIYSVDIILVTMVLNPRKARVLLGVVIVLGFLFIVQLTTGVFDYIPRLRVEATSPDGELAVRVYQQRLTPRPLFPRMGAIARVYDRHGTLIYEDTFFRDSDCDDTLGTSFNQISFEGDKIRIGPGVYVRNRMYVIQRSDLTGALNPPAPPNN